MMEMANLQLRLLESDNQGVDVYVSFVAGGIECEELVSFYIFEKTE